MLAHAQPKTFSVDEYHRMVEAGILGEDEHLELIDGEIVEMPAISARHAGHVRRLTELLHRCVGDQCLISVQNPILLGTGSEPEPDLALLRRRDDFYTDRHPTPTDVWLLIEVADSSLPFDREIKAPLYARHGVAELWIVDLTTNTLTAHRQPTTDDSYLDSETLRAGDTVTPVAFPDRPIAVADIVA